MYGTFKWVIAFAGTVLASSAFAGNPEYHSEPGTVEKDAKAVAYPKDDINAFSDPANKVCTFTVNGATVSGPSESAGRPSWQDLIKMLEQGNVRLLVLRITTARQSSGAGDARYLKATVPLLEGVSFDLANCFKALRGFGTPEQPKPKFLEGKYQYFVNVHKYGIRALCRVTPAGKFKEHSAEFPVLFLRLQSESGTTDSLFVPQGAIRD